MKKKILALLILCSFFTLFACSKDEEYGQLSTPKNVLVENNNNVVEITFDKVENATKYDLLINGGTITIDPVIDAKANLDKNGNIVSYTVSKYSYLFKDSLTYTVQVKAIANKYKPSSYSSIITYESTTDELNAPNPILSSRTIIWEEVENADYYNVFISTPASIADENGNLLETSVIVRGTSFDISKTLTVPGNYYYEVQACSTDTDFTNSTRNDNLKIKYSFVDSLKTPSNLILNEYNGGKFLVFEGDENSDSFLVSIDGVTNTYNASTIKISEYAGVYAIDLTDKLSSLKSYSISVQALSSNIFLRDSSFSSKIYYSNMQILNSPILECEKDSLGNCVELNGKYIFFWNSIENAKDYEISILKITGSNTVAEIDSIITSSNRIEIDKSILDSTTFVAIRTLGWGNYKTSNYSNIVFVNNQTSTNKISTVTTSNNVINWNRISGISYYLLEINGNLIASSANNYTIPANILGEFNIRVAPIDYSSYYCEFVSVKNTIINTQRLETVSNIHFGTLNTENTLFWKEVDDAYSYMVVKATMNNNGTYSYKNILQTSSTSADLTDFIVEGSTNLFNVYAIAVPYSYKTNSLINDSYNATITKTKQLESPSITVSRNSATGETFANIKVVSGASSYRIEIDDVVISENYIPTATEVSNGIFKINLTQYLTTARTYNIQATANSNDSTLIESAPYTYKLTYTAQLSEVTNLKVIESDDEEPRYYLTFETQSRASYYEVKIKTENSQYSFNCFYSNYDISDYLLNKGKYSISIQAFNSNNYFYPSIVSSIQYEKQDDSIYNTTNIAVTKSTNGTVNVSWNDVYNASSYILTLLKDGNNIYTEELEDTNIDITNYLSDEGLYCVKVQSKNQTRNVVSRGLETNYVYLWEYASEFEKDSIKVNSFGTTFDYKITSSEEFKNLIIYSYLYNQNVVSITTSSDGYYNLKMYIDHSALENIFSTYSTLDEQSSNNDKLTNSISNIINSFVGKTSLEKLKNLGIDYFENIEATIHQVENTGNIYTTTYWYNLTNSTLKSEQSIKLLKQELAENTTDFKNFAQGNETTLNASTTDQLLYAVMYGYNLNLEPNSTAETVYNNAKIVLSKFVTGSTDYERALSIYNWLFYKYDYIYSDISSDFKDITIQDENEYYGIESILGSQENVLETRTIVSSESLAKTFALLCNMVGIKTDVIKGEILGETEENKFHYWNKIFISTPNNETPLWYNVDVSKSSDKSSESITITESSSTTVYNYAIKVYNYFLFSDNSFSYIELNSIMNRVGENAQISFNYYIQNNLIINDNFTESQFIEIMNDYFENNKNTEIVILSFITNTNYLTTSNQIEINNVVFNKHSIVIDGVNYDLFVALNKNPKFVG